MAASAPGSGTVIIKKYANRRLYDTESSTYITLEHLAAMVRAKRDFKVVDAKSGEDITRSVLTQIIMDEEQRGGETLLPVNFLRQLISMYGDNMQTMVPQFLEESLAAFQRNQSQFRDAMAGALTAGPFAEIAKRNMEMFSAAAGGAKKSEPEPAAGAGAGPDTRAELAELRAAMAELQKKLDRLSG